MAAARLPLTGSRENRRERESWDTKSKSPPDDVETILRVSFHKTLGARPMRADVERFLQNRVPGRVAFLKNMSPLVAKSVESRGKSALEPLHARDQGRRGFNTLSLPDLYSFGFDELELDTVDGERGLVCRGGSCGQCGACGKSGILYPPYLIKPPGKHTQRHQTLCQKPAQYRYPQPHPHRPRRPYLQ